MLYAKIPIINQYPKLERNYQAQEAKHLKYQRNNMNPNTYQYDRQHYQNKHNTAKAAH